MNNGVLVLEHLNLTYSEALHIVNSNIPVVDMTWVYNILGLYFAIIGIGIICFIINKTYDLVSDYDVAFVIWMWIILGGIVCVVICLDIWNTTYYNNLYALNETAYILVYNTGLF